MTKKKFEIVTLNYISNANIAVLFAIVAQTIEKTKQKKFKKIMKRILNKQIKKRYFIRNCCASKNENRLR